MENIRTTEIFVSDKCSSCKDLIEDFKANPDKYEDVDFININDSITNLRRFLKYRDDLKGYDEIRAVGRVGVPSKVLDGVEVEFFE